MLESLYRVGLGEDIHRLGSRKKPFILAGIEISPTGGPYAHSDGDVVLHALIDALLGALALGDIGDYFPPTDHRYRNIDSSFLLKEILSLVLKKDFVINNVDITIRLESPKLYPYKMDMRQRLCDFLSISLNQISIKAKTNESLGIIGSKKAVFSQAIVLLSK